MKKRHCVLISLLLIITACAAPTAEKDSPVLPAVTSTASIPAQTDTPVVPTSTPTALPPTTTSTPSPSPTSTEAASPTPAVPREQVQVAYEDRVIRGTLLGDGDVAVILAPMWMTTRSVWMSFAREIALQGFTAVAFDFPGAGNSTGTASFSKTATDVVAMFDLLYERGYQHIACVGASAGGGACYEAALLKPEMAGFVVVSSPFNVEAEDAAVLTMPKLYIASNEPDVPAAMKEAFQLLPEPKQMEIIRVTAHGTDIFHTDRGDEFSQLLVDFLMQLP